MAALPFTDLAAYASCSPVLVEGDEPRSYEVLHAMASLFSVLACPRLADSSSPDDEENEGARVVDAAMWLGVSRTSMQ